MAEALSVDPAASSRTEVVVLGCGSSGGTPVIGCGCAVCVGGLPRNQRTRSSCWVRHQGCSLIIDTGPDFRHQALREAIPRVDGVLYTHPHADHLNGIDDLRAYCYLQKQAIPVYGNPFTMQNTGERFDYAFLPPSTHWERPVLQANPVEGAFEVLGVKVVPIPLLHGKWPIYGYRIGNMAWLTDVSTIPAESMALLENLSVLFIDCLRLKPHYTHLSLDEALAAAAHIGAKQTYLIHMTHELDYEKEGAHLPENVAFAYDGLAVSI